MDTFQEGNLRCPAPRLRESGHAQVFTSVGLGISAEMLRQPPPYRPVQPLPGAVDAPGPEVVEHRFPGREIAREHAPLTAAL
jgi:hypothetical protein